MLKFVRDGQRWIVGTVIFFVGIVFVFFMAQGNPRGPENPNSLAEIGDIQIDLRDFQRARFQQEQYMREALGDRYDAERNREYIDQLTISSLVRNAVMELEAKYLGIYVSDDEVRNVIRGIPALRAVDGRFSKELFEEYTQRQYGTETKFVEAMRREILASKVRSLLLLSVGVSDEEVRGAIHSERDQIRLLIATFNARPHEDLVIDPNAISLALEQDEVRFRAIYQDRILEFDLPERAHARHILIQIPGGTSEERKEQLRVRAESIRDQLLAGEDFAELATTESDDPGSKANGGDLGTFGRGQMVAPFEEAVFSSEAGAISEIVETQFGFHIIRTEEIFPAETHSFEEVREEIAREVLKEEAAQGEAQARAEEMLSMIEGGQSLEDAARELSINLERTGLFTRRADGFIPTLGKSPELMRDAFRLETGTITPIYVVEGTRAIAEVVERMDLTVQELDAELPAARERLINAKRMAHLTSWYAKREEALRAQGLFMVNEEMLR